MSAGVMSSEELDTAIREKYIQHCFSRLAIVDVPQEHTSDSRGPSGGMRTRANSMSTVGAHVPGVSFKELQKRRTVRIKPYQYELRPTRSRTKSENESDLPPELPYFALPIDSMLSSNLFKSRSMESIDAPACEDSVVSPEKEQISEALSLTEGESVFSGLHRLNVGK